MPSPVYNNFQNLITFSRASNATLVDATGRITYAPNNLFTYSEQFDNAYWTKGNSSVSANTVVAPDGATTGDTLTRTATTTSEAMLRVATTQAINTSYTVSVYAKVGTVGNLLYIRNLAVDNTTTTGVVRFNLTNGTVDVAFGATYTGKTSITAVGNGWYRCSIAGTTGGTIANNLIDIGVTSSGTVGGTSGDFLYIWGAQFEPVTYQTTPSTYNPTTTAAYYGPRLDYDPATLALKGLLVEEARTNLLTYSEQFDTAAWNDKTNITVTANSTTSPDGTTNADTIVENTATGAHFIRRTTVTMGRNSAFTFSVYAKPNGRNQILLGMTDASGNQADFLIDLTTFTATLNSNAALLTNFSGTATNVGNGWCRATITFTTPNNANGDSGSLICWLSNSKSYTGNGTSGVFLWGAQFEAGAFATSYIPTVAASVARSADLASMTGSQLAPWYNRNAGTFVVQADVSFVGSGDKYVLTIDNADGRISYVSTASIRAFDGTNIVSTGQSATANVSFKAATAWGGTAMSVAANGATPVGGSYDGSWGVSLLYLGSNNTSTPINGHLQSVTYYPRTLSNSQLQSLTS